MRKYIAGACAIVSVILVAYIWAWLDLYFTTSRFYAFGSEMCDKKDYKTAIKGKFVRNY